MDASETGIARRLTVVLLFFILSATSIVFSAYLLMHAYGLLFYAIAISFTALALISCVFNTMTAYTYYKSYFYTAYFNKLTASLKPMKGYPSVAVVMPVYNEDPEMFGKNLHRLRDLEYDKSKLTFYVLDDSTKPDVRERIERISRDNKAVYIHRSDRKGFKAGALNNMLKHSKEEFVAIFDADEYLTNTRFLLDLLPYFQNKEVAFAQTEKSYRRNGSLFTDSVNLFDALFFKFMQPSRAQHGTAIFAGSCGIIRHSAIDAVGGFPEYVTEDAFFSFESDMNNFKSVYVPRVYALGRPITFSELTTQQWRYNYGDTQFLMYFLRRMKNAKKGDAPLPLQARLLRVRLRAQLPVLGAHTLHHPGDNNGVLGGAVRLRLADNADRRSAGDLLPRAPGHTGIRALADGARRADLGVLRLHVRGPHALRAQFRDRILEAEGRRRRAHGQRARQGLVQGRLEGRRLQAADACVQDVRDRARVLLGHTDLQRFRDTGKQSHRLPLAALVRNTLQLSLLLLLQVRLVAIS